LYFYLTGVLERFWISSAVSASSFLRAATAKYWIRRSRIYLFDYF